MAKHLGVHRWFPLVSFQDGQRPDKNRWLWASSGEEAQRQAVAHASSAGAIIRVGEQVHPFKPFGKKEVVGGGGGEGRGLGGFGGWGWWGWGWWGWRWQGGGGALFGGGLLLLLFGVGWGFLEVVEVVLFGVGRANAYGLDAWVDGLVWFPRNRQGLILEQPVREGHL